MFKDTFLELVTICDRFENLKHATVNPHEYTEHGVLMLANVLKSDLATQISIRLVKVFVQLRSHDKTIELSRPEKTLQQSYRLMRPQTQTLHRRHFFEITIG